MRSLGAVCLAILAASPHLAVAQEAALVALRSGRYDEAIRAWDAALGRQAIDVAAGRGLVDALRATGQLARADAAAARIAELLGAGAIATRRGLVARERGRRSEARRYFEQAVAAAADDALVAELELARLGFDTGAREAAMRGFDRFIDHYNSGRAESAEELAAVGVACTYLGIDDPDLFHDAVRAFEAAIEADPSDPDPRLLLGELFLSKYDGTEAGRLLGDALTINPRHPRALLARARWLQFEGQPDVMATVERSLEINPALVEARVFRAQLLTAAESFGAAEEEAAAALRSRPGSLEALAMLAAARYLGGDRAGFEAAAAEAASINPRYGGVYHTTAELAVQNRLYADAVELARRAIEIDPASAAAHGTLGINLLRVGRIEDGRAHLETAFERDPFNVWFLNTLDLLDTFPEYETFETEHFRLFVHRDRIDLVTLYMAPLAEEAYDALTARYGFVPPEPILIEVYDRHADFSVRTLGLAGLGALGVAFGGVVAVDAPAAVGMGEFNWGSTLWHEIAHVMTLGATDNLVPRWLTEGLSVYEERRARTGWGDDVDPGFLLAFLEDRLLPVSRINEGFVRPRYPRHVIHSYLQASLVCELIAQEHGHDALGAMLGAYRERVPADEVVRRVLGLEPDELDARFDAWLRERYATAIGSLRPSTGEEPPDSGARTRPPLANLQAAADSDPDDFLVQLRLGAALSEQERYADAIVYLERARALFPEYGGNDSPYAYLARAYEASGQLEHAVAELETLASINENSLAVHRRLSDLLLKVGRPGDAAAALQRTMYIDPWDIGRHQELAELWEQVDAWPEAVRERAAVVALDPPDRAEAWYRLALAQERAGDRRAARRAILSALEIAPSYEPAQSLLLRLRRESE